MAKPTKPNALKPKADDPAKGDGAAKGAAGGGGGLNMQFILLLAAILLSSTIGPALAMYFLGPMVLVPAITAALPKGGEEGGGHGEHGDGEGEGKHGPKVPKVGMSLALNEFTVNLKKDPAMRGSQFLKTKIDLSVIVPDEENCLIKHDDHAAAGGGGHGEAAPAGDPCMDAFNKKMSVYVPTIRDIINTALMERTANEVASLEGQEAMKDQVIADVNALIADDGYKIMRINLQEFIVKR